MQKALVLSILMLVSCRPPAPPERASAIAAMAQTKGTEGFAKALKPRAFVFPADAGPHPEFQTEWWYYTGNLATPEGRRFGYQLTFFRRALTPTPIADAWRTNQIYFAHFTISDIAQQAFYPFERWSRGAAGLAGAQSPPYRVWLESWQAEQVGDRVRLRAAEADVSLDLYVQPVKPPALQGNRGLSQKSAGVGNASYYYSLSRMASTGTITIKGQPFAVKGSSWLDREWSTSGLSGQQSGWDWFSLQLADGRELMLYQLRLKQGGMDPYSAGSLIDRQGQVTPLKYSDFQITPQGQWKSPTTGTVYPSGWAVAIPSQGLNLTVKPYQPNQELPLTFAYWEGAVQVTGSATGQGYVELTGYGEKQDRGVHR